MAQCRFCTREFASPQGVRAHLRFCSPYLFQKGKTLAPPRPRRRAPSDHQRVHLDRLIRGARLNQPPLIRDSAPTPEAQTPSPRKASENALGSLRQLHATQMEEDRRQRVHRQQEEERQQRELHKQREHRKRDLLQRVKWLTIDLDFRWMDLPREAKVAAKMAIEKVLQQLPIGDYPFHEVQEIAEAIRDRVYTLYPKPSAQITHVNKQEVVMPMSKLLSGLFECPRCEDEFDLDRTPEQEAHCPTCHVTLKRVEDEEEFEDADE